MSDVTVACADIDTIVAEHAGIDGALLPVLHAVQGRFGCVPDDAVALIAAALNLSRAEVHGVITFYHDFRREPPGAHTVQICRAEACQAVGSAALQAHACSRLGVDWGGTTRDGSITLEPVYCLGNCASGPSVRIDDRVHALVDSARFDELIAPLVDGANGRD